MTKRTVTRLFVVVGLVAVAPVAAVVPVRLLAPAPQNDCEDRAQQRADGATFDAIKSLFSVRPTVRSDEVPSKPLTLPSGAPANGNVKARPVPRITRRVR